MADDLAALRYAIDQLPDAVTQALRAVAWRKSREAMAIAKRLVPVDTGYTRDNIHIVEDLDEKMFIVQPGTDRPRMRLSLHRMKRSGRQHTQRVSLNMLPNWLEYGTVTMRARPFMRPAAQAIDKSYRAEMQAVAIATFNNVMRTT